MPNPSLDAIDRRILRHLQGEARTTNTDLAQAVGLSPSPCLRRVKRLEAEGVIRGYATLLDQGALELPVSVFVHITLERQVEGSLKTFEAAIQDWPEVMEGYLMTGEEDYMLRIVAADLAAYERFLLERLTRVPGVANIKSSFALKQVLYKTSLPI